MGGVIAPVLKNDSEEYGQTVSNEPPKISDITTTKTKHQHCDVIITRTFDVPLLLVWTNGWINTRDATAVIGRHRNDKNIVHISWEVWCINYYIHIKI